LLRRRNWPIALAVLFVAQLVWYLLYTEDIVQSFRANTEVLSQMYARVQEGVGDPSPEAEVDALFRLQQIIIDSGVPLVATGPGDTVYAAENLPFRADLDIPADHARVRDYARRLDLRNPPIGDPTLTLIHFGDPPEVRKLRWIPWLQAGGLLLTVLLGGLVVGVQRRAESERAWTAMARELAHQLGTPISSLEGWLELLKLPRQDRPEGLREGEIGEEIGRDLARLERVSLRFELIGREPKLQRVEIPEVIQSLRDYLEARLPRLASGVTLEVDVPGDLPPVMGNEVLLTWALENVVKNSLDALGGKGGRILIKARERTDGRVKITVEDTGPGVSPEIRSGLFEPGITTKARGWGVGLALTRRIVEGVHKGRIELGESEAPGATFHFFLPSSRSEGD
jgi:signal transduction histidine kinase